MPAPAFCGRASLRCLQRAAETGRSAVVCSRYRPPETAGDGSNNESVWVDSETIFKDIALMDLLGEYTEYGGERSG